MTITHTFTITAVIRFNDAQLLYEELTEQILGQGFSGEEELLGKASEVIQQFMARDPDNIQFSMLVLAKNPEEW